jgi:glycosyltransferase involved in cell wall biosynthesis
MCLRLASIPTRSFGPDHYCRPTLAERSDIALVSLGTTPGLRAADAALASLVRQAGASCRVVPVTLRPRAARMRRHVAVTDLVESLAARRAGRSLDARAVIFSTVTAALLQRPEAPYAVRFDSPAALNRPGPSGAWQRAAERRALRGARILLPWGRVAAEAVPSGSAPSIPLPVPVEAPPAGSTRDVDAAAYAGYPRKRGLELLCAAWAAAGSPGRLVLGGLDRAKGMAWLGRCGVREPPGVEWAGELPRARWLEVVGRARVFVNASRWEDHGLSQLEALAAGTPLVTLPSPGPYEALPLARALDARLVASEATPAALAGALRAGLGLEPASREEYARRALELLRPYRRAAVLETLAGRVLPALGVRT